MGSVFQRHIVTDTGDVISGADVTVRIDDENGDLATLYSDESLDTEISNPTESDSEGFVQFYASGGLYWIKAEGAGATITWENVQLGTAQRRDTGTSDDEVPTNADARRVEEIDVAGGEDVTLSESQATARTLRLTGELTDDISLVVPDTERVYSVINEASGGYSVTVKTDGGSGIALSEGSGGVVLLRSDGTDVVKATGTEDKELLDAEELASNGGRLADLEADGSDNDFYHMPQVNGNPIVESDYIDGEGWWTRWANGDQISRVVITFDRYTDEGPSGHAFDQETKSWPKSFDDTPSISYGMISATFSDDCYIYRRELDDFPTDSNGTGRLRVSLGGDQSGESLDASVTGIGEWS